ncbi:protoporphyrinogen oxidase [Chromobacterium vaccinii]|uniref:protoporphyrinogen oxidase n=1 Tax=Chromobacterium vaccinii TaxID=1108595 RepID=UPI001E5C1123|nr:protoporphyrinogen oxidase [Chromobacterium vaccinii]MCD4499482.1 protoporphyrinogen oxidase [Chromobacterium vaccinii]
MMIAIIGAGVSGLSCAWWLQRQGVAVRVFEAAERVGGKVSTLAADALCEQGPNMLLLDEELQQWLAELGLSPLWPEKGSGLRHVLRSGRYRPLPSGPWQLLAGSFLSWPAKWALLRGLLRPGSPKEAEASLAEFCRRRFGQEVLDKLLDPLAGGVFAGDPEELALEETLPRLARAAEQPLPLWRGLWRQRTARARMCTLQGGLQQLPQRLARDLDVRLGAPVTALRRDGEGWRLRTREGWVRAERVVLALPADAAAELLHSLAPEMADICRRIPYAPLAVVSTLLDGEAMDRPLPGYGALHPSGEGALTLGHLTVSNIYPHVCPAGTRLVTSFIGGRRHPESLESSDAVLLDGLNAELEKLFGMRGKPLAQYLARWPQALPQGTGLQRRLRGAAAPWSGRGLHLCANWLDGASLPDCLGKGRRLAKQLAARASGFA